MRGYDLWETRYSPNFSHTHVYRTEVISMRILKALDPRSGVRRTGRSMRSLLGRVSFDIRCLVAFSCRGYPLAPLAARAEIWVRFLAAWLATASVGLLDVCSVPLLTTPFAITPARTDALHSNCLPFHANFLSHDISACNGDLFTRRFRVLSERQT